jgi:hypothetical protein
MQFVGHVAAGALAGAGVAHLKRKPPKLLAILLPAALGGITPDLVDKTIFGLEASVYGRTVGHSLVVFLGLVMCWFLLRKMRAHSLCGVIGYWALGIATHLAGDLADDALQGLLHGGHVTASWYAWPLATPYAWVVRNPSPLGVWPWAMTPLEAAVWGGALAWLALAGYRALRTRGRSVLSTETP